MGRITIFGTDHCPHCIKAKGALEMRGIPYTDIDISKYPDRRQDMVSLSEHGASTVPQIFFNEQHVGGAEDLLQVLQEWDKTDTLETAYSLFKLRILDSADPTDDRLAPVSGTPRLPRQLFSIPLKRIRLPDGTTTTARELLPRLEHLLQPRDRSWKAHWFKKCFLNTTAVSAIQDEFHVAADVAITFLRELQLEHGLLHHVCEDHVFHCEKGGKILFFRLSHHHLPHILNAYLTSWKHSTCSLPTTTTQVSPSSSSSSPPEALTQTTPMETILDLERRLYLILNRYTDHNGLTDYLKVAQDDKMIDFELAACSLQEIKLSTMDETTRKAFCLNVYNLFITFAFIKVGIATSAMSRGAFFDSVKINIGGDLLSFNDLENGILRANTRHPYASRPPFDAELQERLSLSKLDCRIHFGLNCGAKSCPPIRFFRPESLEEELNIVAQSFCQGDDVVRIIQRDDKKSELHLSMLLKWFQKDFCASKEDLPRAILPYLTGRKHQDLKRLLQSITKITIKFLPYDWSANASHYKQFGGKPALKANEYFSATALFRFPRSGSTRTMATNKRLSFGTPRKILPRPMATNA